jgi:hypothetical protein
MMEQFILVRPEGAGKYFAQAVAFPDCRAVAGTEEDAVNQVKRSLAEQLGAAKLVRVEIPTTLTDNPWLDFFGRSASDPDFAAYEEELRKARQAED